MGITDQIARSSAGVFGDGSASAKHGSERHPGLASIGGTRSFVLFHGPASFGIAWGLGMPGGTAVWPAPIDLMSPGA